MFNVAIFGAGRIGQIHARNAAAQPELTLKYVVDPNRAAADALARQTGAAVVDLDAALGDGSISGVIIASATNAHLDQALSAAATGKAIFCEKPLDLDLSRARSAAPQLSRAKMLVGFNRRFDRGLSADVAAAEPCGQLHHAGGNAGAGSRCLGGDQRQAGGGRSRAGLWRVAGRASSCGSQ